MQKIQYKPIGCIHSPFHDIADMPIQPIGAKGIAGTIEIHPQYTEGLKDLEGFSHVILIYHFHLSKSYSLKVKPFLDKQHRGVFATRAPKRPNPIGISVVRLRRIEGHILYIEDIDVVDGTPLLDVRNISESVSVLLRNIYLEEKGEREYKSFFLSNPRNPPLRK